MFEAPEIRDHDDYERGYSDRWYGATKPRDDSAPYKAGWEAAEAAERIFAAAGFEKVGRSLVYRDGVLDEEPEEKG